MNQRWVQVGALVDLAFSACIASLLVNQLGWRYSDWMGLVSEPFDVGNSLVAYTVIGCVCWPVVALFASLVTYELRKKARRLVRA